MNLISLTPLALASFAFVVACSAVQSSNADAPESEMGAVAPVALEADTMGDDVIVGGYGPGDRSEAGAKIAYAIVEAAIYDQQPTRALVDSVDLETQLVAGLNYRFRVEMTGPAETRAIYRAVVYRDLSDNYELTSLTKLQ